jgi:hypothetical protein
MGRLGIHDVAGLVRYAIRVGLVPMERLPETRDSGKGASIAYSCRAAGITMWSCND